MDNLKERACAHIEKIADQLIGVSRDIYEHPELKFEEFKASKLLAEKLGDAGFATKLGVADLETAIQADHPAESDGPTVAIISEYDALPGIGHACGHNLIAAAGLGAAIAVGAVKSGLPRYTRRRGWRRKGSDGRCWSVQWGGCGDDVPSLIAHGS